MRCSFGHGRFVGVVAAFAVAIVAKKGGTVVPYRDRSADFDFDPCTISVGDLCTA